MSTRIQVVRPNAHLLENRKLRTSESDTKKSHGIEENTTVSSLHLSRVNLLENEVR